MKKFFLAVLFSTLLSTNSNANTIFISNNTPKKVYIYYSQAFNKNEETLNVINRSEWFIGSKNQEIDPYEYISIPHDEIIAHTNQSNAKIRILISETKIGKQLLKLNFKKREPFFIDGIISTSTNENPDIHTHWGIESDENGAFYLKNYTHEITEKTDKIKKMTSQITMYRLANLNFIDHIELNQYSNVEEEVLACQLIKEIQQKNDDSLSNNFIQDNSMRIKLLQSEINSLNVNIQAIPRIDQNSNMLIFLDDSNEIRKRADELAALGEKFLKKMT